MILKIQGKGYEDMSGFLKHEDLSGWSLTDLKKICLGCIYTSR